MQRRTSPAETGITAGASGLARAPLALSARGTDVQLAAVRDEVGMPQPQRLPDPHPGLGQKNYQEPVPQMLAGTGDRQHLVIGERARHLPWLAHPQRPCRRRPTAGGVMQERPEPAPRLLRRHATSCCDSGASRYGPGRRRNSVTGRCRFKVTGEQRPTLPPVLSRSPPAPAATRQTRHVIDSCLIEPAARAAEELHHNLKLIA